jgi:ABC-2 type transport system ATP-binding protein
LPIVIAFAQVGASMRVLVTDRAGIETELHEALRKSNIEAVIHPAAPNLEDVFVAATQKPLIPRGEAA